MGAITFPQLPLCCDLNSLFVKHCQLSGFRCTWDVFVQSQLSFNMIYWTRISNAYKWSSSWGQAGSKSITAADPCPEPAEALLCHKSHTGSSSAGRAATRRPSSNTWRHVWLSTADESLLLADWSVEMLWCLCSTILNAGTALNLVVQCWLHTLAWHHRWIIKLSYSLQCWQSGCTNIQAAWAITDEHWSIRANSISSIFSIVLLSSVCRWCPLRTVRWSLYISNTKVKRQRKR